MRIIIIVLGIERQVYFNGDYEFDLEESSYDKHMR